MIVEEIQNEKDLNYNFFQLFMQNGNYDMDGLTYSEQFEELRDVLISTINSEKLLNNFTGIMSFLRILGMKADYCNVDQIIDKCDSFFDRVADCMGQMKSDDKNLQLGFAILAAHLQNNRAIVIKTENLKKVKSMSTAAVKKYNAINQWLYKDDAFGEQIKEIREIIDKKLDEELKQVRKKQEEIFILKAKEKINEYLKMKKGAQQLNKIHEESVLVTEQSAQADGNNPLQDVPHKHTCIEVFFTYEDIKEMVYSLDISTQSKEAAKKAQKAKKMKVGKNVVAQVP